MKKPIMFLILICAKISMAQIKMDTSFVKWENRQVDKYYAFYACTMFENKQVEAATIDKWNCLNIKDSLSTILQLWSLVESLDRQNLKINNENEKLKKQLFNYARKKHSK